MDNPKLEWSGIDTLKLGLGVKWTDLTNHALVMNQLQQMQQNARENKPNEWNLMSLPRAASAPYGRKKYKYCLGNGGTYLYFTTDPEPTDQTPNVMVELQPIYTTRRDLEHCHFHLHAIIDELGGKIAWIKPSELHVTADISTRTPQHYNDYYDEKERPKFTARGRTIRTNTEPALPEETMIRNGRRLNYFRIGGSEMLLRIYNKTQELKVHPEKQWEAQNWNNPDAPHVTRVEFQIRREKLKQFDINSLTELNDRINGTWAYLTRAWFQLHDAPHTSHKTEQPPSEFWETVISARPQTEPIQPRKKIVPNIIARVNQGIGNLITAYAHGYETTPDWTEEEAMAQSLALWREHSKEGYAGLWPAVRKRRTKFVQQMRAQIEAENENQLRGDPVPP
ncbi:MAG: hypothetical protein ACYCUV_16335 [Phycisphaerae bacterium]